MTHYMLDLETLGTKPGCVILSLGCAEFDPMTNKPFGRAFYVEINQKSCFEEGLTADNKTLNWWHDQGETAKALLQRTETGGLDIYKALQRFSRFAKAELLDTEHTTSPVFMWANSPSFDCAILRHAYERLGMITPWEYRNEQDCRTLVQLGRTLGIDPKKDLPFTGTPHNALDDAIHQGKYVSAIYQHIHNRDAIAQLSTGASTC